MHVAAITGKVSIVDELIKHCPDSDELVDNQERNLLHQKQADSSVCPQKVRACEIDEW